MIFRISCYSTRMKNIIISFRTFIKITRICLYFGYYLSFIFEYKHVRSPQKYISHSKKFTHLRDKTFSLSGINLILSPLKLNRTRIRTRSSNQAVYFLAKYKIHNSTFDKTIPYTMINHQVATLCGHFELSATQNESYR